MSGFRFQLKKNKRYGYYAIERVYRTESDQGYYVNFRMGNIERVYRSDRDQDIM